MSRRSRPEILLLAGVPASGKSHFGAWLERTHSCLHLDVERDGQLVTHRLEGAWIACVTGKGVEPFIVALRKLGRRIIVNWGFPPQCLGVAVETFFTE